ncbi:protein turtle homolog A-like [Procambarus clarkii]|uniref:protein turtle homolog A-like n=1 Tax=Procambarus clarkii TaxID=6728 RepID=UPI0037442BB4
MGESSAVPVRKVEGVGGAPAQLPCLASHGAQNDAPVLVLWYKDGARFPFYTLDLREGGEKEEFVDPAMEGRVRSDVKAAYLTLDPLQGHDSGRYRCRVDFKVSPTLFALVNLTVYVVPSRLVVLDQHSRPVPSGLLGPLTEGDPLTLLCVATGGRPAPEVTWWRGTTLLSNSSSSSSHILSHNGSPSRPAPANAINSSPAGVGAEMGVGVRQVRAEVSIPALTRDYLHANLTCRANNNNITEPLSTSLAILLFLRPKTVEISTPEAPLVAGQQARLECVAVGAYPAASLVWTLTPAHGAHTTTLPSSWRQVGEKTSSWVRVVPAAEDHLATATCSAHNPNITTTLHPGLTTSTTLHVLFAPVVKLELGANLGSLPITEGKDVYFECEVASNPPAREVIWRKDGVRVKNDRKSGVLVSERNLVLQMVRRTSAGNYTCSATNTQATTTSNTLYLGIRYLPVCVGEAQTVAVAEGEKTRLSCTVDAQPEDDLAFTWVFNNTLDTVEVEDDSFAVLPGLSILDYTPRSGRDYGTLSCWATNEVGTQADPCKFTVVEAGPPEPVGNCVLVNLTLGSLEVGCTPGNDGGLPQRFVARVYASPTHTLLATMEEDAPRFQVGGLTPGQDYLITITAVNAKGASPPEEIDAVRLKVAEKRMGEVAGPPVSPLVGVFLGLVGAFLVLLMLVVVLTRARSNRCRCWSSRGDGEGIVTSGTSPQPPTTTTPTSVHAHVISHAHTRSLHDDNCSERAAPDVLRTINAELLDTQICPEIIPARVPPPPYSRSQVCPICMSQLFCNS